MASKISRAFRGKPGRAGVGKKVYALLMAWDSGVSIYTMQSRSIQPGAKDFTAEIAVRFAKQHLRFTPTGVCYVAVSDLIKETSIATTSSGGATGGVGRHPAAP